MKAWAMVAALLAAGCVTDQIGQPGGIGGTGVGDLKVSDTERLALNAAGYNAGDLAAKWLGAPKLTPADSERVPEGYFIRWRSWYSGAEIDESKIIRIPELAPKAAGPVLVVTNATPPPAGPAAPPGTGISARVQSVMTND